MRMERTDHTPLVSATFGRMGFETRGARGRTNRREVRAELRRVREAEAARLERRAVK